MNKNDSVITVNTESLRTSQSMSQIVIYKETSFFIYNDVLALKIYRKNNSTFYFNLCLLFNQNYLIFI